MLEGLERAEAVSIQSGGRWRSPLRMKMNSQPAPGRCRRSGLVAAILAMLCTSAACSGEAADTRPTRAASPPAPPTWAPRRTWTPDAHSEEAACRKKDPKPWRPSNAPYTGPGPHHIYPIEVQLDPGEPEDAMDSKDLSTIPDDMRIPGARIPDGWQLIACVYDGQPTRRSGTVKCYFSNREETRKYPFYESRYEVIVREARTGKKVTTLSVPGTTADDGDCPRVVVDTGDTIILKPLDGRALGEKLRPVFSATK
ncbi:hypothetical protein ACQP1W_17370 [Spirillospora sp. CA-255316]